MQVVRRVRGVLLRAAYSRGAALAIGALLAAPAGAVWLVEFAWESWATDGVAFLLGATGLAFILAGLQGRKPDWDD